MDLVFGCLVAHNRFPLVAPTNQHIATNGVTLTGELNRRLLRYRLIYFATSFNLNAWMPRDLYLLIVWNAITVGVIGPYGIKRHIVPDQELRSGLYQMILDCVGLSLGCNPRRIEDWKVQPINIVPESAKLPLSFTVTIVLSW